MKYVYPAVFTKEADGILVDFPDLPQCYTDGKDMADAFANAEDALNLMLWHMEEKKESIPAPSVIESLQVPANGTLAMIKADTLQYRKLNDKKCVRKNLSIPSWLNTMAVERNLNFSNVLQNALMRELNVEPV